MMINAQLKALARLHGIQTSYRDMHGEVVWAESATLLAAIGQISGSVIQEAEVAERYDMKKQQHLATVVSPVIFHPHRDKRYFYINLPMQSLLKTEFAELVLRESQQVVQAWVLNQPIQTRKFRQHVYQKHRLTLSTSLSMGFYECELKLREISYPILLIVHPNTQHAITPHRKHWGVFTPIYALKDQRYPMGSFRALKEVQTWVAKHRGDWVGTLPFFAKNLFKDEDPSPYAPQTKLFWNELYLDLDLMQEKYGPLPDYLQTKLVSLQSDDTIPYQALLPLYRKALLWFSIQFFKQRLNQTPGYQQFIQQTPLVHAYARWMAPHSERRRHYQLFVQYECHRQLSEISKNHKHQKLAKLYMDLPIGVCQGGFDEQHFSSHFLTGVDVGAPPDLLFLGGQNWGLSAPHPDGIRNGAYAYLRNVLRKSFEFASCLRIDHVMSFYRLFVYPKGQSQGVYIKYAAQEILAVIQTEAALAQAQVVGEDLGTVPNIVREQMQAWHMLRMWVFQLECYQTPKQAWAHIPKFSIASLNTHDMSPFAGFWEQSDITRWLALKLYTQVNAQNEKSKRAELKRAWTNFLNQTQELNAQNMAHKLLLQLSVSEAQGVLINLEDLWSETVPQNIPGTHREFPNWCKRHALSMDQWMNDPSIEQFIVQLAQFRSKKGSQPDLEIKQWTAN